MYKALIFCALSWCCACTSKPLEEDGSANKTDIPAPRACSGALKQTLSLVDAVSGAAVSTLAESDTERTIFIDATAGGIDGQDKNPWVYVALGTGQAVAITDLQAFKSIAWDLAFKRFVVRNNSGDSGPGSGGAIRIALPWDKVSRATLGDKALPIEEWFDDDCMLQLDVNHELITSFTGWSEYDEANHVLNAADVVYIVAGGNGLLYKVAILDYYSTPTGAHGTTAGRYKVRIAPLP